MVRLFGWLAFELTAAAQARRFVSLPCAQLPAGALDIVLLLTSELVSNAVLHGAGPARLDVCLDGEHVIVGVTDVGDCEPTIAPDHEWPSRHNGLRLVQGLADRWGVEHTPRRQGKRVWFDLTCSRAASSQRAPDFASRAVWI